METLVETKNVKATTVRKGDIVKGRIVDSVKSGPKWTYIRDDAGKSISEVRNETTVSVERKATTSKAQPTTVLPEPDLDEMRAHAAQVIQTKLDSRSGILEEMKEKVFVELDAQQFLSAGTLGILLTAQADLHILNEFADLVKAAPDQDLVGLQKEFAQRLVDRLVSSTQNRTIIHQEESVVTHLLDECDKEAMARFIESARWYL